jgi:hypothetical protein
MTEPLPEGFPTAEEIVAQYIALRNRVDALKKEQAEALKPFTEAMTALEGAANMLMTATGQKALSTNAGTAFYKSVMSVKNEDPEAFLAFVREHQAWGALTAHVRKEFVEEWMDSHDGHPPPAISVEKFRRVEFRKA